MTDLQKTLLMAAKVAAITIIVTVGFVLKFNPVLILAAAPIPGLILYFSLVKRLNQQADLKEQISVKELPNNKALGLCIIIMVLTTSSLYAIGLAMHMNRAALTITSFIIGGLAYFTSYYLIIKILRKRENQATK